MRNLLEIAIFFQQYQYTIVSQGATYCYNLNLKAWVLLASSYFAEKG